MIEVWRHALCDVCGKGFEDKDHWFDRHSGPDGEELHAECCPTCNPGIRFLVEPADPDDYRAEPNPLPALRPKERP